MSMPPAVPAGDHYAAELTLAIERGDERPLPANIEQAEEVMRRLASTRGRLSALKAQYAVWKERVDDWYREQAALDLRLVAGMEATLEAWAIAERKRQPKVATLRLPSGEVATIQAKEPTVVVDDEEIVIRWADDTLDGATYDTVVPAKPRLLISELRKIVDVVEIDDGDIVQKDATGERVGAPVKRIEWAVLYGGERVPGVHVEPPETTAKVKPAPLPVPPMIDAPAS